MIIGVLQQQATSMQLTDWLPAGLMHGGIEGLGGLRYVSLDGNRMVICRLTSLHSTNLSPHRLPSSLRTDSTDFTTGPFLLSISVLRF